METPASPSLPEFVDEPEPVSAPPKPTPLPNGTKKVIRAQRQSADRARVKAEARPGFYTLIATLSALRTVILTFAAAVIVSTIFASFTLNDSLSLKTQQNLAIAYSTEVNNNTPPTALPTPSWFNRIGFIRGHYGVAQRGPTKGNIDPGAVCNDIPDFTELSVTTKVGDMVMATLRGRGYTVDALDEWDMRLVDPTTPYEAAVLLSIHADSCTNFNDGYNHSGFKVVGPEGRVTVREQDLRLADCIREHYSRTTGLDHSGWTVTNDMLYYHAFREVSQRTPAAILELGFLYYDRDLLKNRPEKAAEGIVNGLLCFLDPKASTVKP
jgi:N-acetylmuramoyl-L-alanine amidase